MVVTYNTSLHGEKCIDEKILVHIYLPGWLNLGGVVYGKQNYFRVELVLNQQLYYYLKIWELTEHICREIYSVMLVYNLIKKICITLLKCLNKK